MPQALVHILHLDAFRHLAEQALPQSEKEGEHDDITYKETYNPKPYGFLSFYSQK